MLPQEVDKECAHKGREDMMESTTISIMSKGNEICREMPADVSKTVDLVDLFIYYLFYLDCIS